MDLGQGKAFKSFSLEILPKVRLKTTVFSFDMHLFTGGSAPSVTTPVALLRRALAKVFLKHL